MTLALRLSQKGFDVSIIESAPELGGLASSCQIGKYVWDRFKKQIRFPVHFPGLRNFSISDGHIYVLTFKKMKGDSELVVLDLKGNFLKKAMIPLKEKDIYYYPYCIYQEHFYQLVENVDQEQWELEAWPIR